MADAIGLCISQWSSGLSSNYDWRDKMLVVLIPQNHPLIPYLTAWRI